MAGNKSKEVIDEKTTELLDKIERLKEDKAEAKQAFAESSDSAMLLEAKISDLIDENDRLYSCLSNLLAKVGLEQNSDLEAIENFYPEAAAIKASAIRQELLIAVISNMDLNYPRDAAQRAKTAVDEILKTWGICDGQ